MIDVFRRLSKSALSLQMDLGRGDPISLGVENDDLITVVTLAVKYQFVSVMAMRAGCHRGFVESRLNDGQLKVTVISIPGTVSFFQEALGRSVPE